MFLDLWKAYDSVNRHKLFKKLNDYEVSWNIIKLLWQIYNNYEVIINGVNWIKIDTGLPQGSWLSPILFNIYINNLLKELDNTGAFYRAYADDIVIGIENEEQANNILGIVKDWSETSWIEINPRKSGLLKIGFKKSKLKEKFNILGIQEWSNYKYLGVKFDQGFTFKEEIRSLKWKEKAILK